MPSALTAANLFDAAYDETRSGIQSAGFASGDPWSKLLIGLRKVVGPAQFEETGAPALEALRKAAAKTQSKEGEGEFLAAGADVPATGAITDIALARAAALKLLRHTHFLMRRGAHKLWIVTLPKTYADWPQRYLKTTRSDMITRLADIDEQFSKGDQKHISTATQTGLKWVMKALIVLDDTGAKSKGLRLLKRWFADADTTDDQLRTFAATLKAKLKIISTRMSDASLIVTDFVPIRFSTDATDKGILSSNAFVWADTRQVVYIEPPFFSHNASNVFQKDARHWARIMVHEMTHRIASTVDKRYGWAGVKPIKGSFPSADAMVNADSWALFVADAAGAMNATDLSRALNGVP